MLKECPLIVNYLSKEQADCYDTVRKVKYKYIFLFVIVMIAGSYLCIVYV